MMSRLPVRLCVAHMLSPAQAKRIWHPLQCTAWRSSSRFIQFIDTSYRNMSVHCSRGTAAADAPESEAPPITVQVSVEATASCVPQRDLDAVARRIEGDALELVQRALLDCSTSAVGFSVSSKPHELSIVLCDDEYMTAVNREWRGLDRPTDVLSFEIPQDEFSADLPIVTLGDVIISLDTATSQAKERQHQEGAGYTLYDEVRVLLVHGILHLLGYDHEMGPEAAHAMAQQEVMLMQQLDWKGRGLIEAVGSKICDQSASSGSVVVHADEVTQTRASSTVGEHVRVVCLDMDGTLLNSASQITPMTARVLQQCLAIEGLTVMLATGKARTAAISACSSAGLAGKSGIVHDSGPGVFLQGLATYGPSGEPLRGPSLEWSVVETALQFAEEQRISCCAFLGDTCATTFMTPYLKELHTRYYEPLSEVMPLAELLAGPEVKKLLFMTEPHAIDEVVKPQMEKLMAGTSADTTQAVDSMLEIVPRGTNKWIGISQFLEAAGLEAANVLAIGDGMNDYDMLLNAGTSIAVANAKEPLLGIADRVFESNDDDGVAKALRHYLLNGSD
eukprot:jgi/Ulvmu1/4475/UM002_0200.1